MDMDKGHLGYFHVLAIVNSAAKNNGIHVSFSILLSSEYIPSFILPIKLGLARFSLLWN